MQVHHSFDALSEVVVLPGRTGDPWVTALPILRTRRKVRQPQQQCCCRLFLKLGSYRVYPARHAYHVSESPSKPLQPHSMEMYLSLYLFPCYLSSLNFRFLIRLFPIVLSFVIPIFQMSLHGSVGLPFGVRFALVIEFFPAAESDLHFYVTPRKIERQRDD